jgi:transposase
MVAVELPGQSDLVEWQTVNEPSAIRRMVRKIERMAPGEVRSATRRGPAATRFSVGRIEAAGKRSSCAVIAPSLIPRKPGERIKTDKRDARKLVRMFSRDLLTEVLPPTEEDEALRDLCRAREDAKQDLTRCWHRLGKLLLRRGLIYTAGKKAWTQAHRAWLRGLRFEATADQAVFDDYLLAIEQLEERLRGLELKLKEVADRESYAERVGWLRCFRGIDTVTAITILAELHDFRRFESPRGLMAYLGLVPSEDSSAGNPRRGAVTKAGNAHARPVLIESSWHYRHRHRPGVGALRKRREGQPARAIAIADKAQQRLNRRYRRMTAAGMPTPKVATAIARELVGFIWSALRPAA